MGLIPQEIPKTDEELARQWQPYILKTLMRLGRVKFNAEDVFGYVNLRLIEAQVVAKFWAGVREQSHALTVSAEEAADMLGITLGQFVSFQIESEDSLDPVTVHGKPVPNGMGFASPKARFLFTDVIALSSSVTFPEQGVQKMPPPHQPTLGQWRCYLDRAIRNASTNFARSWSRHCSKEHAPDYFGGLFRDPDGALAFEDSLVDARALPEEALAGSDLFRQAPKLMSRVDKDGTSFSALLQEFSFREAAKMAKLTAREIRIVRSFMG